MLPAVAHLSLKHSSWLQVWSMALAATHDAGVLLVHWASLLNACKQL